MNTMEKLILDHELGDDELRFHLNKLVGAITTHTLMSPNNEESEVIASCKALNEHIRLEVKAKPILAKIVSKDLCFWSLLMTACQMLQHQWSHPAIKFLIEMNPSALLWEKAGCIGRPIYKIAGHESHCVLMPWIAEKYAWVLDHESCQERPPVFILIDRYANRYRNTGPSTTTLQLFFENYPRSLAQEHVGSTPLHRIIIGNEECEEDIFKWMAKQCPSSMLKTDDRGWTPLHNACIYLKDGSNAICKFLIANAPEAVWTTGKSNYLPIHLLQMEFHHRPVMEVVILLLQKYPESFDIPCEDIPAPNSGRFVQRIMPYLDEERESEENTSLLQGMTKVFREAVTCTKDPLMNSTCDIFDSWATSRLHVEEDEMERISAQLEDVCDEFEGLEF